MLEMSNTGNLSFVLGCINIQHVQPQQNSNFSHWWKLPIRKAVTTDLRQSWGFAKRLCDKAGLKSGLSSYWQYKHTQLNILVRFTSWLGYRNVCSIILLSASDIFQTISHWAFCKSCHLKSWRSARVKVFAIAIWAATQHRIWWLEMYPSFIHNFSFSCQCSTQRRRKAFAMGWERKLYQSSLCKIVGCDI